MNSTAAPDPGAVTRSLLQQAVQGENEQARHALDTFIAQIGHELRRPLGAIVSAVEVLERCAGDAAVERDARSVIARQSRHLARVVNELLEIARGTARQAILAGGTEQIAQMTEQLRKVLAPQPAVANPAPRAKASGTPTPRRRSLLLAGHERAHAEMLRSTLQPHARQLTVVPRSGDAMARLLSLDPEVVVVDVGSPGIGMEFARKARAAGFAGRMVAIGADVDESHRAARSAGFDACVAKPGDVPQLLVAILGD